MSFRDRYFDNLEKNATEALDLMAKKNEDYAKEYDPFQNFRDSAQFAGISLEQGILVRLGDKFTRYRNLMEKGSDTGAVGESIMDTLLDAMNYTNILKTWHDMGRPTAEEMAAEELPFDPTVTVDDLLPPFDLDANKRASAEINYESYSGNSTELKTEEPKLGTKEWIKKLVSSAIG